MTEFNAVDNSTIYDVCLNTYGTLNLLGKLMTDNNFPGVETYPKAGQVFLFDETLVANQAIAKTNLLNGEKYATKRIIPPPVPPFGLEITTFVDGNENVSWSFSSGGSNFDMTIYWGDGTANEYINANDYTPTHSYALNGTYIAVVVFTKNVSVVRYAQFDTGANQITDINNINVISGLMFLDLSTNLLTSFDKPLPNTLTYLILAENQITVFDPTSPLPAALGQITLSNNLLTAFDPTLPLPDNMTYLYLDYNQITVFDPTLTITDNLRQLVLDHNLLTAFDPTLALPANLELLQLIGNQILTFDPHNNALPAGLKQLYLQSNNLTGTWRMTHFALPAALEILNISNNPNMNKYNGATFALPSGLVSFDAENNVIFDFAFGAFALPAAFIVFRVDGNKLPTSMVNIILLALDAAGYNSGTFSLDGQLPAAPPSGTGATAKANLIGRGCVVNTD